MPKSWMSEVEEATGPVPAGGYKLVIEDIELTKTGEDSKVPGAKMYVATMRITEPKKYAGTQIRDWFTIGTEDDPRAKEQETWKQSYAAKRLARLLKRAGVAARDGDDEEWQDSAQGQEVCVHLTRQTDDRGTRNKVNGSDYFKETDDEFVGVGELLEAPSKGASGGARGARGGAAEKPARPRANGDARATRPPPDDDDDDAPPTRKVKPPVEADDDDDDEPTAKPAGRGAKAEAAVKAAPKGGRKLPVKADDDDDDED